MTDVNFFLFCDAAAMTRENKMIIHGTFDNIASNQFPVIHPSMTAVFRIEGPNVVDGAELTFRLKNVMAEEDVINQKFPLKLDIANNSFQGIFNIVATQFANPGMYQGILMLDGKQIAATKLNIIKI